MPSTVDLGEAAERAVVLRDATGAPVNADVLPTWAVTLPDGAAGTSPAVTQTGVGAYRVLYVPTVAGHHADAWSAVLDGQPVRFRDAFRVRGTSARPLLALDEVRKLLGVPADPERDEQLRDIAEAASAAVERATGKRWRRLTVTAETHPSGRGGLLLLRNLPVAALTEVRAGGTPLAATAVRLASPAAGVVMLPATLDPIEVDYIAGHTDPPTDVVDAVRLKVMALWRTRSGASGSPRRATGGDNLDQAAAAAIAALGTMPGFG